MAYRRCWVCRQYKKKTIRHTIRIRQAGMYSVLFKGRKAFCKKCFDPMVTSTLEIDRAPYARKRF